MANYDTNIINFSLLKQYKSSFNQEKSKFNNSTYKTFSSSYLKSCSDSNIKRLSNSLDLIYKKIQKGYNSIDKWWEDYNKNAEGLENSLSSGNPRGITKSSLNSFVSSRLGQLTDYKSTLSPSFNNYNQMIISNNDRFLNNGTVGVEDVFSSVGAVSKVVSSKKVDSYVSKVEDFQLLGIVGTSVSSASSKLNDWVDNAIGDVSEFFNETGAKVTTFTSNVKTKVDELVDNANQTLIDTFAYISNKIKNLWNRFINWLMSDAIPWIKDTSRVVWDVIKSVGATVGTVATSLVEGIMLFGEALIDFGNLLTSVNATLVTGLIDGGKAIYGAITGKEWESTTKKMWEDTMGFVSTNYVGGWFDSFYENNSAGKWLKDNAWGFDTVRSVGSGIGYVAGVVALTVFTFGFGGAAVAGSSTAATMAPSAIQMAAVAAAAGVGKGTQEAWNDGAELVEGLGYGVLTGAWEGVQFYLGNKIGGTKIFGSEGLIKSIGASGTGTKILNALGRIVLDGADGGVEGVVQPLLTAIYKDGYTNPNGNYIEFLEDQNIFERYSELFDDAGGWKNIGVQTAVGLGSSMIGEAFDLGKLLKNKDFSVEPIANIEIIESVSETLENKINELYKNELSLTKTVGGMLAAPLNMFSRFKNSSVVDNIEISNKMLNDGLYHFTSLDSAVKILDSGYLKESDYFTSYGRKKSFFFAGIPTVEDLAVNVSGLEPKRVAVKFDVDSDSLIDFKYRKFADKAISYDGRYNFDKSKAHIVYLGLFEENGSLVYKELSKVDFDNYTCDIPNGRIATSINNCRSTMLGISRELDYFNNNLKRLKELLSGAKVKETKAIVSENVDSILKEEPFVLKSSRLVSGGSASKKSFVEIDLKSQLDFIDEYDIKTLIKNIPKTDADLDEPVVDSIINRILKNQDYLFSQLSDYERFDCPNVYDFVAQNEYFLKNVSDENLVRLFGIKLTDQLDPDTSMIVDEITRRINNGNKLFDINPIDIGMFGAPISDVNTAFIRLPKELQESIISNGRLLWDSVPEELKTYDYGNTFFQQYHIASLIEKGNLDPNYLQILREVNKENPNLLKTFNFDLLDRGIVEKLGVDYIKEMARYDTLSVEIVSLYKNNPKLFNVFCDIINNSKLDDSLNNFYLKNKCSLDFIFQNANELNNLNDSAFNTKNFIEYILYKNNSYSSKNSGKIIVDYTNNYLEDYIKQCDIEYHEALNSRDLDKMKNAYFNKYYSVSYDEAKTFISKYYDHISEVSKYDGFKTFIDGAEGKNIESFGTTILEEFKYIDQIKDVVELDNMYNSQKIRLSAEEMMTFDAQLKKMYSSSYVEALQKTKNNIDSLIADGKSIKMICEGKEVDVVDVSDDFSFLVYSSDTGFVVQNKQLINNSYVDTWYSIDNPTTHGLSTSYISNENIGCCPVNNQGVLYLFDDIDMDNIAIMAPYDLNSHIRQYGFGSENSQIYISAEKMPFNTVRVYNEIVLDRTRVKPNGVIVYSNATKEEFSNALKAASEWDVPVIRIDKTALANKQINKINGLLSNFDNNHDLGFLKEAIDSYEASVSGYKLNALKSEGTDKTASIDNEDVRYLFSPDKIMGSIEKYVSYIESSNDRSNKIEQLINILDSVNKKYEITNKGSGAPISRTESLLKLDRLIEFIKAEYYYDWKNGEVK